jgi:hypothetical protein
MYNHNISRDVAEAYPYLDESKLVPPRITSIYSLHGPNFRNSTLSSTVQLQSLYNFPSKSSIAP